VEVMKDYEPPAEQDQENWRWYAECIFCATGRSNPSLSNMRKKTFPHKETCPVLLARRIWEEWYV